MRSPNALEKAIFDKLLEQQFPGRDHIRSILSEFHVEDIDENGSLKIITGNVEAAPTSRQIPVEGYYSDQDGIDVHLLLRMLNGVPEELEIYKDDGSEIIARPLPENIQLLILPSVNP